MAPQTFHGHIRDRLGEAIVGGVHAEGSALPPEPALCEALGVSRTVVREAIKSLAAKGLVSTGPKVGTRVRPAEQWNWFDPDVVAWQSHVGLTREFLQDVQELRRVVEPAAVRLAAERATATDIAELEAAFAGMTHAVRHGGDYVTSDLRFHQTLLRAAHNRMMVQMSRALGALLRTSFEVSTTQPGRAEQSLPLHRAILDAVIARRPVAAERASLALIDSARDDIEAALASSAQRGRSSPPARRGEQPQARRPSAPARPRRRVVAAAR